MFKQYRNSGQRAHGKPFSGLSAPVREKGDLPFDLELTRRVTGAAMAPKWGTRDPAEAPLVDAYYDSFDETDLFDPDNGSFEGDASLARDVAMRDRDLPVGPDLWSILPEGRFGHGGTPLEMQMRLIRQDRTILRAFDDLRTQLVRTMHGSGWSRIAIAAPTAGSGASFTAVNLALSVARIPDMRALLMDLDQRGPDIAHLLGMKAGGGLPALLAGDIGPQDHLIKPCTTLAVGLGRGSAQDASEILHARRTGAVMDAVLDALRPDIAIYDLPPMLEHDDLEAFLPQVDGVLLVADATRTLASQITECERRLEGKTHLLGIILNRTRPARPEPRQRRAA
ncbi:Chromosome partitioning ATPase, Mrp family, contains Fe-S cluster [Roseovarius nanhaiticus]|uniref:Chromosome partitioning ATPase, Mrp family, contains Fe-S cluster n=1 Tax=Roseovarius nanhaiticus TaxID=573024 RepID=A0A1N7HIV5_9RHOB|nr:CpsD/CapB family tyrosine-protein kinase [Roseovarius nanhaiticus]SEK91482.1 Chromosome partitioning ATPase, Mrp family, contains Fe-S cluster [Roseovarius nanhaiticus]SIS24742.1 Chromosome partitioning ATPase, Mrp family, contains Fe-S cluster [Roseovarius nanhaiticus]